MMTQATTPEQKLARSRRRLQSLKELQKRPNLSPEGQKKLPGLIEMQERVIRMREKRRQRQALLRLSRRHETSTSHGRGKLNPSAMH